MGWFECCCFGQQSKHSGGSTIQGIFFRYAIAVIESGVAFGSSNRKKSGMPVKEEIPGCSKMSATMVPSAFHLNT